MNNLSLNYTAVGEGEPFLIIHGLFGSSRNWKSLGKQFAQQYRVILLDLRNHGDSPFDSVMDYEVMANDVVGLMDDLGIQSAHILGHSMGGKVAMKLNQLYPERVKKLVVADIAPVSYQHDYDDIIGPILNLELAEINSRKDAENKLERSISDQRVRSFLLQSLAFHQGKAHWKINWEALNNNMLLLTGYENIEQWKVNNPSMFIRGEMSPYVNTENISLINRHFTRAKIATLENAGHWLHFEQPVAFFEAVSSFLNQQK